MTSLVNCKIKYSMMWWFYDALVCLRLCMFSCFTFIPDLNCCTDSTPQLEALQNMVIFKNKKLQKLSIDENFSTRLDKSHYKNKSIKLFGQTYRSELLFSDSPIKSQSMFYIILDGKTYTTCVLGCPLLHFLISVSEPSNHSD